MTAQKIPGRRLSNFLRVFVVASLVLSALSALWSIATPISAAPDEPAHLIKAASVVRGQFVGQASPQGHIVQVPAYVAYTNAQTCYAFHSSTTADCIPSVPGDAGTILPATTTAGLYNPLYYLIIGWPSLLIHDESGIYWMRIVSGIAVSLILALAFALIATWRRPTIPMLGLTIASTPMVFFLNGSVNPNSMEIAATLSAFVAMLTIVKNPDRPKLGWLSAIVFVSAAIAANMRGLSLLWLAIALLTPLLLIDRSQLLALVKRRSIRLTIAGTALAVVFAAAWVFGSNSLGAGVAAPGVVPPGPGVGSSPLWGFVWTAVQTFDYAEGIVGIFGWLDTPAPLFVFFTWSVFTGGAFLLSFLILRGRALWFTVALIASLFLLPPLLQGYYITGGGIVWQGRYILPIFVCAVVAAASGISDRVTLSPYLKTRLLLAVFALWGVAQFQSFSTALRRYSVGIHAGWLDLLNPEWSPPGGVWMSLVGFGVVLLAATVLLFVWLQRRPETARVDSLVDPTLIG